MQLYNFISFSGIFILLIIAWLISRFFFGNKEIINWHLICWGIGLQILFALFIFIVPAGIKLFQSINDIAVIVLSTASDGARFVFGTLAVPPGDEGSLGFILAFQAFPTIIFFSALVAILYYYNILPFIIGLFAKLFTRLMKISGAEALCAASNIFVGVESAFTIKPYIQKMTRSELCTILTAGMATVASNVLALYVFTLYSQFPSIAGHLISASFLSAPAALVMSKILFPETGIPETMGKVVESHYEKDASLFEAIINGATSGLKVVFSIVALLIAVLGLVALTDLVIGNVGSKFNILMQINIDWSLKGLLGYIFYPFTLIIGIPIEDAKIISQIIGERIILTEVASYQDLAAAIADKTLMYPRSAVVASYALCGFAHVASMAIFVGGITALAPERTGAVSRVAFKALIAATLACLMTACIAGTFFTKTSILFG
ncbi:MAG: nucleoside transporter [Desulfobacula sp.]|jgi:CNT family concentrative nucleoside transporter|uniref:NupC/NupG family nucleoside CNT transporter n=1 Tax=Desulfobacula sp. TaxID=2593537 RepID=UPI001DD1A875|nr:nucleoside transporter [Desulfobacula sp.]MBT3486265.1 nucleoside transporter [Desulfobacula sp.]MBT3805737.1 nucleoside transporter [Desulfobacula sp.]MBT4025393.1 nucleoside transporter [Desulfobacula sp.]MBT4200069.1 nucleoside transporter [Desulfobacula sp.]